MFATFSHADGSRTQLMGIVKRMTDNYGLRYLKVWDSKLSSSFDSIICSSKLAFPVGRRKIITDFCCIFDGSLPEIDTDQVEARFGF